MKLQHRDIDIINYAENNGGTIQQYADLFYNGNYFGADRRLLILEKNKLVKGALHPIVNKKVYYKGKMPSYHKIISQDIYISNKENIQEFKREAKLDKHIVDIFILTKKLNVYVIEIDIFNKTTNKKIEAVTKYIKTKLGKEANIIVYSKKDIDNKEHLKQIS